MKVLLICGSNRLKAPYIEYYISELKKYNISYNIICWNRDNNQEYSENCLDYYSPQKKKNLINDIRARLGFRQYVLRQIKSQNYNKVIIFSIQFTFLFYDILNNKFRNKYIFDIRDFSPLYNIYIVRKIINKCIRNSFANCISSPGFKEWLPKDCNYVLSHNIHQSLVDNGLHEYHYKKHLPIKILTIGQIRDVEENYAIVKNLANKSKISLTFIGIGPGIDELKKRVFDADIKNVYFQGRYSKAEENSIVEEYDMINACMPDNTLSRFLMSNRIYLAALLGKPIIVTAKSTQAEYVNKYNLGITISSADQVETAIMSYWNNFNIEEFNQGRKRFLLEVESDMCCFCDTIKRFIYSTK